LKPGTSQHIVVMPPQRPWVRRLLVVCALLAAFPTLADARPRKHKKRSKPAATAPAPAATPAPTPSPTSSPDAGAPEPSPSLAAGEPRSRGKEKAQVFDFTGLDISGRLRTPQLLYFLERANEELERASLERRSFIPEMMRTVDEEQL